MLTLQELSMFLDRPKNASMKVVWGPAAFDFWTKLELFKSYLETTEQFLVIEAQQRKKYLKDAEDELTEELRDPRGRFSGLDPDEQWMEYHESLRDVNEGIGEVDEFANILRQSFFTSLYGYWESQLFLLSQSLRCYDPVAIPSRPHKSHYMLNWPEQVLKRVGYPLKFQIWRELNNYRMLRNCILHHEGKLDGDKKGKALNSYINSNPSLSLPKETVVLDKGFCEEVHQTIADFFTQLLDVLEKWGANRSMNSSMGEIS